jgi:hypothetical protein
MAWNISSKLTWNTGAIFEHSKPESVLDGSDLDLLCDCSRWQTSDSSLQQLKAGQEYLDDPKNDEVVGGLIWLLLW